MTDKIETEPTSAQERVEIRGPFVWLTGPDGIRKGLEQSVLVTKDLRQTALGLVDFGSVRILRERWVTDDHRQGEES